MVNPALHTVGGGDDAAFAGVLAEISEESNLRLSRSTAWNMSEAAFGLGTLAAAAYGGYNASYGGENLKDAAFAAASVVGLKGFLAPGSRRDANLQAGVRLSCLYRHASTFAGPPTTEQALYMSLTAFGVRDPANFMKMADAAEPAEFAGAFADLAVEVAGPAQSEVEKAISRVLGEQASANLGSVVESELEIYEQRFVLVATVYRAIRAELAKSTKFSAGGYDALLADFTVAVKEAAKNEAEGEAAAEAFTAQTNKTGPAPREMREAAKKYAAAKAAMLACAPLN